jgi:hypothetical protein
MSRNTWMVLLPHCKARFLSSFRRVWYQSLGRVMVYGVVERVVVCPSFYFVVSIEVTILITGDCFGPFTNMDIVFDISTLCCYIVIHNLFFVSYRQCIFSETNCLLVLILRPISEFFILVEMSLFPFVFNLELSQLLHES